MRRDAWFPSRWLASLAGALFLVADVHADPIGPGDFDIDLQVLTFDTLAPGSTLSNDFACSERLILRSTPPLGAELSVDPADWMQPGETVSAFVAAIPAVPESSTSSPPHKVVATKYDVGGGLVPCERCGIALHFIDPLPTKVGLYVTDPKLGQTAMFSGPSGLLGSVVVAGGRAPEFVGWEDPDGITQLILRSRPSAGIGFDDLMLSGAGSGRCMAPEADADVPIPDEDADGEPDVSDLCPTTSDGAPVDTAGCSTAQFCASIDAKNSFGRAFCVQADWMNDEPVDAQDCRLRLGLEGRADRCLSR
jgi:hypothetical protein